MCDWDQDSFMSSWDKTYVSTNVKAGSKAYDDEFFMRLNSELADLGSGLEKISYTIIAIASCAVGRADIVGRFFDRITTTSTPEESQAIFLRLREAITIVYPFLGMPTCIPACYGMIGVVKRKGHSYASVKRLRAPTVTDEDVRKGQNLRTRIYSGVGNSAIFELMDTYFTELFACSTAFTWGYLISKANEEVFEVQQSHLIVATAITALGAVRQTKSHIKATIGIGNSVEVVSVVVSVVGKIAEWADKPLILPDVAECASQIRQALN